jgi:4'-phosphopantetheinyl transferase
MAARKNLLSLHYAAVPTQPWPELERAWLRRLPRARRARILRLREPLDRNASLLGYALLARACRAQGIEPDWRRLRASGRGKPTLIGGPDFSIAHAGRRVACAVLTRGRVGLDLEPRAAVRMSHLRLALNARERAALAAGRLTPADAFVMKEAAIKAAGASIAALPRVRLRGRRAWLDASTFRLTPVNLGGRYSAWIATDKRAPRARVRLHRAESLLE